VAPVREVRGFFLGTMAYDPRRRHRYSGLPMQLLLALVCAWVVVTTAALVAAVANKPTACRNLVGSGLVIGAAITVVILTLP